MEREYDCEPEYARECDDCEEIFTHPYFAYYCNTKYDSRIHRVCNTCFCENSTFCLPGEVRCVPDKDRGYHNPFVSAIYCFEELELYNLVDDLEVWADLAQYLTKYPYY
jgi:hypothetical protein